MSPSTWNLRLNWPIPSDKRRLRPISAYNVSTVRASEKNVQLSRIGSRSRAFQRAIDEVRMLSLTSPKGGSKSKFVVFVNKIQVRSNSFVQSFFVWKRNPISNPISWRMFVSVQCERLFSSSGYVVNKMRPALLLENCVTSLVCLCHWLK